MPAPMPAATPSQGLPLSWVTAKAATAPMAIMPSAPRLSTPAFSFTSRPSATMISGVPATTVENSIEVNRLASIAAAPPQWPVAARRRRRRR